MKAITRTLHILSGILLFILLLLPFSILGFIYHSCVTAWKVGREAATSFWQNLV